MPLKLELRSGASKGGTEVGGGKGEDRCITQESRAGGVSTRKVGAVSLSKSGSGPIHE